MFLPGADRSKGSIGPISVHLGPSGPDGSKLVISKHYSTTSLFINLCIFGPIGPLFGPIGPLGPYVFGSHLNLEPSSVLAYGR
jgi:hypothetical protein